MQTRADFPWAAQHLTALERQAGKAKSVHSPTFRNSDNVQLKKKRNWNIKKKLEMKQLVRIFFLFFNRVNATKNTYNNHYISHCKLLQNEFFYKGVPLTGNSDPIESHGRCNQYLWGKGQTSHKQWANSSFWSATRESESIHPKAFANPPTTNHSSSSSSSTWWTTQEWQGWQE